jgi:serine/threonine protein kinase
MNADPHRVTAIVRAALGLPTPEDRAAYLAEACAGDGALRERVESLLKARDAGSPLSQETDDPDSFASTLAAAGATQTNSAATGCSGATPANLLAARYELGELIGEGGMGVVRRARDLALDREVAVKLLKPGVPADSSAAARFVGEAKVTGQLQHPGIPAVHELGTLADGQPFLAMKLVKGQTLAALLHQRASPAGELGRFVAIFEQVCHAVGYAHAHRVIHRDLKPGNVMVGAHGEVHVMDWGLAKVLGDPSSPDREGTDDSDADATVALQTEIATPELGGSATRTGSVLGTTAYMAPEQAGGEIRKLDARSDVFGLGAILCQILTGRPPYAGRDENERRIKAVRGEMPEALARLDSCGAEPELVAWCRRCLALKQEDRPADGRAVAVAVAGIRQAAEARARQAELDRELALVRAAEQAKRRQAVQWAAGAVAAVLLLGVAGTSLGLYWANEGRKAAVAAEINANAKRLAAERAEANEAQQRKKAEQETALANAVKAFLQFDVLQLADPATQQREGAALPYDADVRLRDVVLRATERIQGKFEDRPLVEADIRFTLGNTLLGMGRPDLAAKQYERVRELRREQLGPDHADTLSSMNNLANSYAEMGRAMEALKLREETLALQKSKLGPDHIDTLKSMNNVASSYYVLGRHAEALKLHDETLALRKASLGPDHPDTLWSMNNVANCYSALNRHDEALKLYEETLTLQKDKVGADHPDTLSTMNNLANSYTTLDRHDEALKLRQETLALRKAKLGPDHPDTLGSVVNLGVSYLALGRLADAVKLYEEALPIMRAKMPDHHFTINCMHNLATSYNDLGRPAEALKLHEETLVLMKAKLGPDHPSTFWGISGVATSLVKLDRGAEAVTIIDECLARAAGKPVDTWVVQELMDLRLRHFQKAGDPVGCRTTAQMLEKLNLTDARSLYKAACWRAVTAAVQAKDPAAGADRLAKGDAEAAMAWLQKAVAAGYKNRARIDKDTDLNCLRDREDFQKLLAELK